MLFRSADRGHKVCYPRRLVHPLLSGRQRFLRIKAVSFHPTSWLPLDCPKSTPPICPTYSLRTQSSPNTYRGAHPVDWATRLSLIVRQSSSLWHPRPTSTLAVRDSHLAWLQSMVDAVPHMTLCRELRILSSSNRRLYMTVLSHRRCQKLRLTLLMALRCMLFGSKM